MRMLCRECFEYTSVLCVSRHTYTHNGDSSRGRGGGLQLQLWYHNCSHTTYCADIRDALLPVPSPYHLLLLLVHGRVESTSASILSTPSGFICLNLYIILILLFKEKLSCFKWDSTHDILHSWQIYYS